MKIIYASDIHEAYGTLEKLFRATDADLYIISGDLIYSAFTSLEKATRFTELQQFIRSWSLSRECGGDHEETAQEIIENPCSQGSDRQMAEEFLRMTETAHKTMLMKYQRMADIFAASGKRHIITIPGNYDMDLARTALSPWDLHKKSAEIDGLKISGYGGAPVFTPGIPENLQVKFCEKSGDGTRTIQNHIFFSRRRILT